MRIFGLFVCVLISQFALSQYYYLEYSGDTPGGLNQDPAYPDGSGQASGWNSILGPSVASPTWSADQTVPFAFDFNGAAVTQYKVSSTGVLTFDLGAGTAPDANNVAIPDAAIPNNSICVWGLEAAGTNDAVSTKVFGSAPNRQLWIHFSSCTNGTNTWSYWSIVLEETSNDIFLVDQRHSTTGTGSLTAGIQIDGATAISVTGSPNLPNLAGSTPESTDDYYYRFIYGSIPAVDVELTDFDILPYIGSSATDISGTFFNYGSNTITAVDITWDDGTGPYTENVTGLNIATNDSYSFTHATQLNPTAGNSYTIDLTIVATGDVNTANNTIQKSTVSLTTIPEKIVVGEEKTGTWCGWCPRGAVALAEMEAESRFIGIAVHNGDPMVVTAYDNAIGTYVPGGYPGGGVDRVIDGDPSDFQQMFNQRESEVVPCEVSTITYTHNPTTSKLEVSADVEFFGDIAGDYRLSCVITEDDVINSGNGWDQVNYYDGGGSGTLTDPNTSFEWSTAGDPVDPNDFGGYDHVARTLSDNDILGDAGSLPATMVPTGTYSYDFADVNDNVVDDILKTHAIVMIVNANTGEILNAKSVSFGAVGIEEETSNATLSLFPNPTSGNVNIAFDLEQADQVSIVITDMLGKVVMNTGETSREAGANFVTVNGDMLTDGIYFVNLKVGDKVITEKLIVTK